MSVINEGDTCLVGLAMVILCWRAKQPTECSCQSRFVTCIGRNFEISLRRRGIVNGMCVHSAQK